MDHDAIKRPRPDRPIHDLHARRWSPYAFDDRPVAEDDLRSLFEAARWTASSYNEQPWAYIVATKADPEAFAKMLACLVEANQAWAGAAPVLTIGCVRKTFRKDGKPNAAAEHDLGAASFALTLEAVSRGLYVHQMIGILPDKVRETFGVPDDVAPLTALAIGHLGDPSTLPENLRTRDVTPKPRRPLAEFVFGDAWGHASPLIG
ncbi:nitroreductase family protein [Paludisphaera soli]|uniref:nitroreductase family protein n=1 Tax=Paludisphaera soli TaxID=2712865 RepID=UPI0013ED44FB|nr:nitroreductase family protein [Paludisphaera soli]